MEAIQLAGCSCRLHRLEAGDEFRFLGSHDVYRIKAKRGDTIQARIIRKTKKGLREGKIEYFLSEIRVQPVEVVE